MTPAPKRCPACRRAGTVLVRFVEHDEATKEIHRPQVRCSADCGWWTKEGGNGDEAHLAGLPVEWRHADGRIARLP